MRNIVYILILFSTIVSGQSAVMPILANRAKGGSGGGYTPPAWSGNNVYFYGNSITAYGGATVPDSGYTSDFCRTTGAIQQNYGQSGRVIQPGVACAGHPAFDTSIIVPYSSGYPMMFIALGVNDIGVNNSSSTASNYQTWVNNAVSASVNRGWAPSKICIVSPFYNDSTGLALFVGACGVTVAADTTRQYAFVAAAFAVASSRHTCYADMFDFNKNYPGGWGPYFYDGIHPNDAGHRLDANFLVNLIYTPQ